MKGQKGITLVALVITIIVMLILVGVSITVALNGGLFDTAKDAKTKYEGAASNEANSTFINVTTSTEDGSKELTGNEAIEYFVNGTVPADPEA